MITAWRLCSAKRAAAAFDGRGAERYPGRWNLTGVRVAYAAESRSLAALETLVNAGEREVLTAADWVAIPVEFDRAQVYVPARFPSDWRLVPAPESTRKLGSDWAARKELPVMRVPSAVTLGEFNYVLNPLHPDFGTLRIGKPEPFKFDTRV